MKICKKCGVEKELEEFYVNKAYKDGFTTNCKSCLREYQNQYLNENPELKRERAKANQAKYYNSNKEYFKNYSSQYRENNKEYFKSWREDNKSKSLDYAKEYYNENKEEHKQRNYRWRGENLEKQREYHNQWKKSKRLKDPHIERWKDLLKNTLDKLKQNKINNTITSLGYSPQDLKKHLDLLGVNWEEHDIDHKIPITWFEDYTSPLIVNDLRNLQPMLKSLNKKKGNRGSDIVEKSYYLIAIEFIKTKYKDKVKYE